MLPYLHGTLRDAHARSPYSRPNSAIVSSIVCAETCATRNHRPLSRHHRSLGLIKPSLRRHRCCKACVQLPLMSCSLPPCAGPLQSRQLFSSSAGHGAALSAQRCWRRQPAHAATARGCECYADRPGTLHQRASGVGDELAYGWIAPHFPMRESMLGHAATTCVLLATQPRSVTIALRKAAIRDSVIKEGHHDARSSCVPSLS